MWNLEKWYRWSYFQNKQRHKHRAQMYGHQAGKGEWDELEDWDWHVYTIGTMYKIDS